MKNLLKIIREFNRRRDWEQYHSPKNLAMALSVEVKELSRETLQRKRLETHGILGCVYTQPYGAELRWDYRFKFGGIDFGLSLEILAERPDVFRSGGNNPPHKIAPVG